MHGTRPHPSHVPPDGHRFDHDSWTHGLMSAALGRGGVAADEALALRAAVDEAVSAIPTRLLRAAREAARARRPPLHASFAGGSVDFDATFRAERERIWVDATVGAHHVRLSVESMGRQGRTGVVQGIDAPSAVARDVLATLSRHWEDFLTSPSPSRSDKDVPRVRSTLAGSTALMHPR